MQNFEVDTYKVSAHLRRFMSGGNARTRTERVLEFIGPVLYHGIQNRAVFAFNDAFNTFNADLAGYVSQSADGLFVVGWFPRREFDDYYGIAQSEKPLHVEYTMRETGEFTGYCGHVGLNTGTEPIGEGPADSEASLAQMLMSRTVGQLGDSSILPPADIEIDLDLSDQEAEAVSAS